MQKEVRKILGIPVYSRSFVDTGTTANPTQTLIDGLGGGVTDAGVSINENSALTISAVWRAINVVSGTLAFLPLGVYERSEDNSRKSQRKHPAQKLLDKPSPYNTDFTIRQTLQAFKMLWGNAYAVIRRNESTGYPEELIPVHPKNVLPYKDDAGMFYRVKIDNLIYSVPSKNMIHLKGLSFDGVSGVSVIGIVRESLGLTKAAEIFGSRFFGNGTNLGGVLESPGALGDIAYKNLRESWSKQYQGLGKTHTVAILEGGVTFKPLGMPLEDAQFLQTRKFQVTEIARWFGVAPHLLFDLERSTNNNIEHQGMEFATFTLAQDIKMWEAELNMKLFSERENMFYVEFNINALLRADSKARSEFYKGMFAVGALDPNEIRQLENMPAYDGGDRKYVQAGFVPTDKIDEMYSNKYTATP
jgi:HK97 family phage portal protein